MNFSPPFHGCQRSGSSRRIATKARKARAKTASSTSSRRRWRAQKPASCRTLAPVGKEAGDRQGAEQGRDPDGPVLPQPQAGAQPIDPGQQQPTRDFGPGRSLDRADRAATGKAAARPASRTGSGPATRRIWPREATRWRICSSGSRRRPGECRRAGATSVGQGSGWPAAGCPAEKKPVEAWHPRRPGGRKPGLRHQIRPAPGPRGGQVAAQAQPQSARYRDVPYWRR